VRLFRRKDYEGGDLVGTVPDPTELEAELPVVANLFQSYFHQDWDLEHGTPDEVIDAFIRGEMPHAAREARLELVSLLGRSMSDRELAHAVFDELGLDYSPSDSTLREWLEHVRDRLAEAPLTSFVMAVPIIPARDTAASTAWYRDNLGFEVVHLEPEYAIVERDGVGVHFWGPSGIEPADSMTMFRIRVGGIDELYEHCQRKEIVHPNAPLEEKPWGAREFAVIDGDGNLLTFFER
jgi:catechol 2,3-dioxygenase-like lactoylglutathione lyase family enzyme